MIEDLKIEDRSFQSSILHPRPSILFLPYTILRLRLLSTPTYNPNLTLRFETGRD